MASCHFKRPVGDPRDNRGFGAAAETCRWTRSNRRCGACSRTRNSIYKAATAVAAKP